MPNPNIAEHGRNTRFKPGQSGNPKGRPRVPTLTEQVRAKLEARADEIVAAYMTALLSSDEKLALQAADAILDRLDGRPTQRTEMAGGLTLEQIIADQAQAVD